MHRWPRRSSNVMMLRGLTPSDRDVGCGSPRPVILVEMLDIDGIDPIPAPAARSLARRSAPALSTRRDARRHPSECRKPNAR